MKIIQKIVKKKSLFLTGIYVVNVLVQYSIISYCTLLLYFVVLRFYWSINLGAAISYTFVSYICQYGIPQLGGQNWGFFVGYMIPCIMMLLAILIFVAGTNKYKVNPPRGSVIGRAFEVCYEAYWKNRNTRIQSTHTLDKAMITNGGSFSEKEVTAVKYVVVLLPFLAALIPYWGIYSQMSTGFQNQGCQMDLSVGSVKIPVSALNLFDTVAILLLVPVFDGYVYPFLKSRGYALTMLSKISWGFFLAALSMVVAGLVEMYRLENKAEPGDYYDISARDNISPCQDIDNYNPYQFQKWEYGDVSQLNITIIVVIKCVLHVCVVGC
jgi:hypothetical protein